MSILSNDIFEKLITIGDKYFISMLRVNCPYVNDWVSHDVDLEKMFPFRGIDYMNTVPGIAAIEETLKHDILEAPITKVQCTTQRYAHIKRCIKKHVAFEAYRCVWETDYAWGPSWKEPKTIHVVCKYKRGGAWEELIRVAITLKDERYYEQPF